MLVRPQPLPDEIERSYLGLLMRINGYRSERDIVAQMAAWTGDSQSSRHEVSCLQLLSKAAGMDLPRFVQQHTTLPFRRGITSYKPGLAHGSEESRSMLWSTGMRVTRPGAYFCAGCVREDLDFHGRSYWRREHQLPGLFWCPKHRVGLSYCEEESAFLSPPSQFVRTAHHIETSWVDKVRAGKPVKIFLELCGALLETVQPFDTRMVRDVLQARGKLGGFRSYGGRAAVKADAVLLSDRIRESFPCDWMAMVFPALVNKKPGVLLPQIDGVLWMATSASSVIAYALATSVLFDSADSAFQAFIDIGDTPQPRQSRSSAPRVDDEQLRSMYVAHSGSYGLLKTALGRGSLHAISRLQEMGLPNLSLRSEGSIQRAAVAFLIEKKSIEDSAKAGNILPSMLESVLRNAATPLLQALQHLERERGGALPVGKARPKPLSPVEANTLT